MTVANPNWANGHGAPGVAGPVDPDYQAGLPPPPLPYPFVHAVAWSAPSPVPDHPVGVPMHPTVWDLRSTVRPYLHDPPNLGAHGVILPPDMSDLIGGQEPWLPYHQSFLREQPPADWTRTGAGYVGAD